MLATAGRRAVVLGLGMTGLSLARHLVAARRATCASPTRATIRRIARHSPPSCRACASTTGAFDRRDVRRRRPDRDQPGRRRQRDPAIRAAVDAGTELVGDIELFARALPADQKVLAITGTNGKTTVASLTGALTRAAGLSTVVAGNIGHAGARCARARSKRASPWPDVFVLELSSYQLETTTSLRPVAAAVLNVSANHMDRYAGIADYAAAKARIFAQATVQILNRDDPIVRLMRLPGRTAADVRRRRAAVGGGMGARRAARRSVARARRRADHAGVAACARRPPQRAERARGTRARVVGGEARPPGARCARRVSRLAAPDGADRRRRRRAVHRRFQGHDGRRDAGRARGHRPAGRADRRRRRQGPELRAARVAASIARAARCC